MAMYPNNRKNEGFSLLELILAVAIFAVGSIVAGYLIINATIATRENDQRAEADEITREGIEAVESIADGGFSNINVSGPQGLELDNNTWKFIGGGVTSDISSDGFTRSISVNFSNANGAMATSAVVVSAVAWTGADGASQNTSLTTFLTDWRGN